MPQQNDGEVGVFFFPVFQDDVFVVYADLFFSKTGWPKLELAIQQEVSSNLTQSAYPSTSLRRPYPNQVISLTQMRQT